MIETLILVWACIAIIGAVAIIIVKYYFKEEDKLELDDISTKTPLQEMVSEQNNKQRTKPISNYFSKEEEPNVSLRKEGVEPDSEFNPYIVPETNERYVPNRNISYSSQNQVIINYDETVEKTQEPITPTQRDIMNQRKREESPDAETEENKHELKDLFTIDELIEESKRKDDERDRESKTIRKETEDNSDIKESIKKNQEAKKAKESVTEERTENPDATNIRNSINRVHEIADAIKTSRNEASTPEPTASQKDINEAIDTATNETEEETPEISETTSITDAVIKKEPEEKEETTIQETLPVEEKTPVQETLPVEEETPVQEAPKSISDAIPGSEEIKSPSLKTPTPVEEDSVSILPGADEDYEFGASIDSSNLFEDENGELSDLDYRKDLNKLKNSIKNSGIVKDLRDKLSPEEEPEDDLNEDFIRNVNTYTEESYEYYDDYAPIINETHEDYVPPTPEEQLRQENTRKVFDNAKENAVEESAPVKEERIPPIKEIPEKSSLKVTINNNEEVLRKGDEIIFNHEGETYSSKVYSINGDNIKVKYRRQEITIKPKDIKKIY